MGKGDGCERNVESNIRTNYAIVNSVDQGNFTFIFSKKSGKSQGISETSGCGNHVTLSSQHNSSQIFSVIQ